MMDWLGALIAFAAIGPFIGYAVGARIRAEKATARLVYREQPVGLTLECSSCAKWGRSGIPLRILYGVRPRFCAWCGSQFGNYEGLPVPRDMVSPAEWRRS